MTSTDQHTGSEAVDPDATVQPAADGPQSESSGPARSPGIVGWIKDELAQLPRPDRERQPCAAELREYSRRGIYTTEPAATDEHTGAQRSAHLAYTRFFAGPVSVMCDWIKYIVASPERFGAVMLIATLIAVGLFLLIWL